MSIPLQKGQLRPCVKHKQEKPSRRWDPGESARLAQEPEMRHTLQFGRQTGISATSVSPIPGSHSEFDLKSMPFFLLGMVLHLRTSQNKMNRTMASSFVAMTTACLDLF